MHILRVLAIGCVAALSLTACGSSGKSGDAASTTTVSTVPKPPPPKSVVLQNGNALCASYQTRVDHIRAGYPDDLDAEGLKQREREIVLPLQRELLTNLRAYPAPDGDAETLNAIWASFDEVLNADVPDFDEVNAELAAYGFKDCVLGR